LPTCRRTAFVTTLVPILICDRQQSVIAVSL